MHRPTISLACILKNEKENIPRLLESVKGCFDKIHLTDTGSTDGSIELIRDYIVKNENPSNCSLFLHHFEWINDFSAARNYSFSHPKTDYIMWMDLDDVLSDAKEFIDFRDFSLKFADFWLATYHYASDDSGNNFCSFARERIIRRAQGFKWNYFIHEGILPIDLNAPVVSQYARTWTVNHKRSKEDAIKDRSRNITMMEARRSTLNGRMLYYYGKELFENQKFQESLSTLKEALIREDVELHDRVMGIQYSCLAARILGKFDEAIALAHAGLQLDPNRSEFFNIIGDCYANKQSFSNAIPYYSASINTIYQGNNDAVGPIFQDPFQYKQYPLNMLSKIAFHQGNIEKSEEYIQESMRYGKHPETEGIKNELEKIKKINTLPSIEEGIQSEDILITCHPNGFYEWDEEIYKTVGIGGSETAVVEMARHLHELTGRNVLIFNNRSTEKRFGAVRYIPAANIGNYVSKFIPKVHIAWRHNVRMTNGKTYIWNHDLGFPGIDNKAHYEKVLCLSEFHKQFVKHFHRVNPENVLITKNGINPERFKDLSFNKIPGKVVFSSSPDRGIKDALAIMDIVHKQNPEATFHVFYGVDNMRKLGKEKEADELVSMMESREYCKYRGNISQTELTKELAEAEVWLYPTNFLETYCITALEMLSCKVYPVVRGEWGALEETIESCKGQKSAIVYDNNPLTYADRVLDALNNKRWKEIEFNPQDHSWRNVAKSWVELMGL